MISVQPPRTLVGCVALASLLAALSLSGCSETRRALGYDKAPPDEFAVVSRAPLSQPPDYTLRPPEPGAPRPQEGTTRDQARNVLIPGKSSRFTPDGTGMTFAGRSSGEQVLLSQAGADKAPADIRKTVNEETLNLVETDKSFTDEILFWQKKPEPGEIIDATKEDHRLRENSALGKSVTEGETPQIIHKPKGWLEDIF